ncbi:MAG: ABC transporter ATP-binding protein [Bifidobacteriaceae bacterium]|jgi:peptide/nickel transport system ATP-binding protein|nr:ABC transporter ATP-binding protein [Bifidobacteriaceae bacterium]
MTTLLTVRDLTVTYSTESGPVHAVRGAALDVERGSTLAIVGESGSGKTTLASGIVGLLPSDAAVKGSAVLDGKELLGRGKQSWRAVRGKRIGYVPQDPMLALNEVWSVGHHFRETVAAHGLAPRHRWRALTVERLAEAGLDDPERAVNQFPHQLSGGMRQRVAIALALLARPELIIADEPTSALDVVVQKRVLDHLQLLTSKLGTTLILITHDLGLVADRSEYVAVMKDGAVVETGRTAEVIAAPEHPYTRLLLSAVPKLSSAAAREAAVSADSPPSLELRSLTKDFPVRRGLGAVLRGTRRRLLRAVDQVDLTVASGQCVALVGESGSGKTTVARLILGLEKATSGDAVFPSAREAGSASANSRRGAWLAHRAKVQAVFQDPYGSLDPQFTVARTLEEPLVIHGRGGPADRRRRAEELLSLVDLPRELAGRYPSELSGGQRQRVAIARALALEPEVLVLDEAVSALDVLVQAQILESLRELRRRLALAMLFITHDLAVVAEIADQVAVISRGRIVEAGPVPEVFANPSHPYTRELLDAVPGREKLLV